MKKIVDFQEQKSEYKKKQTIKQKMLLITSIMAVIAVIIMVIAYSSNKTFRKFADKYIFRKIVSEEKLNTIPLNYDSNVSVIGYNKHLCVLTENTLKQYNSSGKIANEIKVEVNQPIYSTKDRYLAIGEKNSSKIYLIGDTKVLWEKEVDGNVAKIDVNNTGYVTVILTGTTHKSVIATYDSKGNEMFKIFLASTTAVDAEMSPDNNYLAFAEINTTGTLIQSDVKIVSVEKTKQTQEDSIVYTFDTPANSLITNIEYKNKDTIICMCDTAIYMIANNEAEEIMKLEENDKKISIADISLIDCVYRAIEKPSGLFQADTVIEMLNIATRKETVYTIEGVAKSIYCKDTTIAINLGQEVDFINTTGWLLKSYDTSQDVQDIIIANGMAGVVYIDKIEIINL